MLFGLVGRAKNKLCLQWKEGRCLGCQPGGSGPVDGVFAQGRGAAVVLWRANQPGRMTEHVLLVQSRQEV